MNKILKAVDWYKVAGLALLFWLCIGVNNLKDEVSSNGGILYSKLNDVSRGLNNVGIDLHGILKSSLNPLTVEVKNPTNAFGTTSFKVRTN